ncbi:MAG TPA: GNAT family N-acetyltransferase [Jiangellaceae bacterium]
MTLTIEKATLADEPTVRALYNEAIAWLAEQGSDQWQPEAMKARKPVDRVMHEEIERGDVYLVREGGEPIGTFALDDYADPEFWTAEDGPDDGLYIHRMVVARSAAGRDIGAAMIDWSADQVARAGRKWLRLDAWITNTGLHDYYRRQGFEYVRTVNLPWRPSGALFQRPVVSAAAVNG